MVEPALVVDVAVECLDVSTAPRVYDPPLPIMARLEEKLNPARGTGVANWEATGECWLVDNGITPTARVRMRYVGAARNAAAAARELQERSNRGEFARSSFVWWPSRGMAVDVAIAGAPSEGAVRGLLARLGDDWRVVWGPPDDRLRGVAWSAPDDARSARVRAYYVGPRPLADVLDVQAKSNAGAFTGCARPEERAH
jgi:hypothetical protein